jgi:tripartite-type tricarboxylate transporter receptor subunit TctC
LADAPGQRRAPQRNEARRIAINAALYEKLNFDFIRDIAPVAGIIRMPNVILVNPSFPAKTVPEFIAYAKANPGKLTWRRPATGPRLMYLASCSR